MFIMLYITFPNKEEADKIIKHLLNKKLIACANTFPIKATSCWTGKIIECDEIISIIKTKKENEGLIEAEIKKMHSYKVPCIIKIKVEANKEYEDWINEATK